MDKYELKTPKTYYFIFVIEFFVVLILGIINSATGLYSIYVEIYTMAVIGDILCVVFLLAIIFVFITVLRNKLIVNTDSITVCTMFKKKNIKFSDISEVQTKIKGKQTKYRIMVNGKSCYEFTNKYANSKKFIEKLSHFKLVELPKTKFID